VEFIVGSHFIGAAALSLTLIYPWSSPQDATGFRPEADGLPTTKSFVVGVS
jgi:hypothetical protein